VGGAITDPDGVTDKVATGTIDADRPGLLPVRGGIAEWRLPRPALSPPPPGLTAPPPACQKLAG
jgi:hypothetical protein